MTRRKVEAWNADPISLQSTRRQEGPLYPFSGMVCYSIAFHMEKFLAWHRYWKLCLSFFTFLTYSSVRCTRRLQEYGAWAYNMMTKCSTEGKNICSAKAWFSLCRRCGRLLGIYAWCFYFQFVCILGSRWKLISVNWIHPSDGKCNAVIIIIISIITLANVWC